MSGKRYTDEFKIEAVKQVNPHWKKRQRRLLRNRQRLAVMVSTLVTTENGGWKPS